MGRVAQTANKTKLTLIIPLVFFGAVVATGIGIHNSQPKATITTQDAKTTYVTYDGVEGQKALDLLKKYATVETKHYSFGDLVVSINGTPGNGPKYWSFYVNGKMAEAGASSYVTHASDKIEWKLQ